MKLGKIVFSAGCILILAGCFLWGVEDAKAETGIEDQFRKLYYETLADHLFATREIPENLELAIEYLKKAKRYAYKQPGINWKITRCFWVLATQAVEKKERARFFKEGILFGKMAVENDPTNSNAHLWYVLIAGSSALDQGVMNSIYMKDELKKELEIALKLNPKNTLALIAKASWYFYIPEFLGGNKARSFQLLKQALKLEPNYTVILLRQAEFLIAEKKFKSAAEALKGLLRIKKPVWEAEGREDKAKAKAWLNTMRQKGQVI